ncbi:BTB/POZ domain-containing protein 9 [Aphelenchoides fujianensis]|nr:BTB/POZ domain-containing protein 9 [Aphelenchoides fujianensis]
MSDDASIHSAASFYGDDPKAASSSKSFKEYCDVKTLTKAIGDLCTSPECSDVTLIVENERIPAHRVVLGVRSEYFRALLFGGLKEQTDKEVELKETPLAAFRILLRYIYTGRIQFASLRLELVLDILQLVNKYNFLELERALCDYLKHNFYPSTVCMIYATASFYSMNEFAEACLDYIDRKAEEVLQTEAFYQLSAPAVCGILSRGSLCAPEVFVFKAVAQWLDANREADEKTRGELLDCIRLPLISMDDLLSIVRPTGLIPSDRLLDVLEDQRSKRNNEALYRGFKVANVNIAASSWGAWCVEGTNRERLFREDSNSHGEASTLHSVANPGEGIVVELGRPFIINHIQLMLLDRTQKSYCYYVEVAFDRNEWVRVADYSAYTCRGLQRLFFPQRVVKYIRVLCTRAATDDFHLLGLKAMFTTEAFNYDPETTLLRPVHNVATIEKNAAVVDGVSRSRNSLLNGSWDEYDWDHGYTCHQLGSSSIIVRLPQPYLVSSMRLLLWDLDDRVYSFNIDVSPDNERWTRVIEASGLRSWQTLRFPTVPAVFIRIEGTYNSANEVFHVVHFECPAEPDSPLAAADAEEHERGEPTSLPVVISSPLFDAPPPLEGTQTNFNPRRLEAVPEQADA